MEIDLTEIFNFFAPAKEFVAPWWNTFKNSIFYDLLKGGALVSIGYGIKWEVERRKNNKEEQAIRDEDFTSHEASITQLAYIDTRQQIEGMQSNYFLQFRHRLGHVEIEAPFSKKIQNKMANYIELAMEKCTAEEPVVFQYLKDVVPEEDYKQVCDAIRKYWRYHFSSAIAEGSEFPLFSDLKLKPGYEPEKEPYVPVLVYDPDAKVKELKVLWFTEDQIKNAPRPQKEHVWVESPNSLEINTKPEIDDPELEWVDLYNSAVTQLRANPGLVDLSRVGILTGEDKKIPKLTVEPKAEALKP